MILICTDLKILNDKRVLSQVITTALIKNSHKMAAPNRMRSLTNPEITVKSRKIERTQLAFMGILHYCSYTSLSVYRETPAYK